MLFGLANLAQLAARVVGAQGLEVVEADLPGVAHGRYVPAADVHNRLSST
jgi:hypothetical protein